MPVTSGLAAVSDDLVVVTVVVYAFAMLAFAVAAAVPRRALVVHRAPAQRAVARPEAALVGAGVALDAGAGGSVDAWSPDGVVPADPTRAAVGVPVGSSVPPPAGLPERAGRAARVALALTVLGWATHLASLVSRGVAEHRVPWGNMFEFSSAGAFAVTSVFLAMLTRQQIRYLGVLVMLVATLTLGLAGTVLYTDAGPLVPALNSAWLEIHVTAAIVSSGIFTVGSAAAACYLLALRYRERVAAGRRPGVSAVARSLPAPEVLDRVAYRAIAVAFPLWTFAVIAGAIWAEAAWGRYWGWDPKETWAFITWVLYAGYLHARSTAGWRGRKAAWVALAGFAAFLFNYFAVNILIVGLHSYA